MGPEIEAAARAAYPRALATLIRLLGDVDAAEEALQEAVLRACEHWPAAGLPDNPVAWLVTTGRHRYIDLHRQASRRQELAGKAADALYAAAEAAADDAAEQVHLDDDLLRLVFTCCHPALAVEARIALTLRTIAGLSVEEIARAFLVAPRTMEQRLTRAKRKIAQARIPYRVPPEAELPERLAAVLATVYLIFNEGYSPTGGPELVRLELCREAIRLARLLGKLFRGDAEVTGLLALMLFQHARHRARRSPAGELVALDEQDRRLWDRARIHEAHALLDTALARHRPGAYQVQAAIAALHCDAARPRDTDWEEIAALYAVLERMQPTPVVRINRAVAVGKARGAAAGLELLADLTADTRLEDYLPYHLALAALRAEQGDRTAAREAYLTARALAQVPAEQRFIDRRLAALDD